MTDWMQWVFHGDQPYIVDLAIQHHPATLASVVLRDYFLRQFTSRATWGGRQPCGGIPSVASKTLAILNYNERRESRAVNEKQKKSQGTREELSEEGAFGECGERSAAAFALLGDIFDSRRGN